MTLTEFELKKILIDKINSSESYLTAPEHRECYDGLVKPYNLDKDFFSLYDVYSLKGGRDDKDKDEGPSAGSDRGLKKRKTSRYAKPTTSPKTKDSSSRSSKGTKSQPKSSRKFVYVEESEFEVEDTDTPQGQEGNQEPTDLDWNEDKTPQKGPTQNWLMTLATSTSTGPAFRLLKGTHLNYAILEYDFKECYKALLEKFDWETPKEVEKDDLSQKFLTSLAPEWLMHTILWRNRNDLDTISLDDSYNHLKVYESEVQKKSNLNSHNMAFISSSKNSSGNEDGNNACVSTSSTTFPSASANVATISQGTASAYIASQSNGLTNQKLSASTVTRWVISQESAKHPEVRKDEGKKAIDNGEDNALVADAEAPTEFALMANTESK
nr:hypothetical protein [Tanacetum cinerariifolium]